MRGGRLRFFKLLVNSRLIEIFIQLAVDEAVLLRFLCQSNELFDLVAQFRFQCLYLLHRDATLEHRVHQVACLAPAGGAIACAEGLGGW